MYNGVVYLIDPYSIQVEGIDLLVLNFKIGTFRYIRQLSTLNFVVNCKPEIQRHSTAKFRK